MKDRAILAAAALLAGSAAAAPGAGERPAPAIEVLPYPAFFVSTSRGVAKSVALEVLNRDEQPVEISIAEQVPGAHATLEALEAGRRYRLMLTVPADAPAGRSTGRLALRTSNESRPMLHVGVNTIVRERVYSFPDVVDLGSVRRGNLAPPGAPPNAHAQTLMVYQSGGRDFRVKATTDVPGLEIHVEPGPRGDRVQLTIQPVRSAAAGAIDGTISLETNDPAFRVLQVPVRGKVAD